MANKSNKRQNLKGEGGGQSNAKRDNMSRHNMSTERDNRVSRNDKKHPMNLKGRNDVSWYVYSQAILDSTANLYFPAPIGVPYDGEGSIVPGLMVLNWSPTYGVSDGSPNSPVNVAKNSLYAFVRHENAGHTNYEAADLFMYMLAMDSLYCLFYEAQRVYGITKLYSHANRYYPRRVIEALGWNPDDVIKNSAKLQAVLNNAAFALGSFAVPANLSLFERHKFLATNIFMDDVGAKAQSYIFKMTGYWRWEGFKSDTGTKLVYQPIKPSQKFTVDSWAEGFMEIVNAYLADEDVGIMTGDMLRCFGKEGLLAPTTTAVDSIVLPVYDAEIATQIQNAVCVGRFSGRAGDCEITQHTGNIKNSYVTISPSTLKIDDQIYSATKWGGTLNVPADVPTPADVMVSTQLAALPVFAATTGSAVPEGRLGSCSSEVIHDITMYTGATGEASQGNWWPEYTFGNCMVLHEGRTTPEQIYFLNNLAKFRWHPYVYAQNLVDEEVGDPENPTTIVQPDTTLSAVCLGDAQNITEYTDMWLENRNRVALYTMLNSPSMGMFNPAK